MTFFDDPQVNSLAWDALWACVLLLLFRVGRFRLPLSSSRKPDETAKIHRAAEEAMQAIAGEDPDMEQQAETLDRLRQHRADLREFDRALGKSPDVEFDAVPLLAPPVNDPRVKDIAGLAPVRYYRPKPGDLEQEDSDITLNELAAQVRAKLAAEDDAVKRLNSELGNIRLLA